MSLISTLPSTSKQSNYTRTNPRAKSMNKLNSNLVMYNVTKNIESDKLSFTSSIGGPSGFEDAVQELLINKLRLINFKK